MQAVLDVVTITVPTTSGGQDIGGGNPSAVVWKGCTVGDDGEFVDLKPDDKERCMHGMGYTYQA